MGSIGAVIVAAGRSSRMGSFKPLLPLRNSTIIEQEITAFREVGVTEITVVTGRESDRLQDVLLSYGVSFIENRDYAVTDMFHSAKLGLSGILGKTEMMFFLPADIPLFKTDSLRKMCEYINATNADIVIPTCGGKMGHPILLRDRAIPELVYHEGSEGLRGAIAGYSGAVSTIELADMGILLDADTPEDYELIRSLEMQQTVGGLGENPPRALPLEPV